MKIKGIITEDWVNYKKPSMTIEMPYCSFKCDKECGKQVCQNSALANAPTQDISASKIVDLYMKNDITQAIVFQGLEPFDSWEELLSAIGSFRQKTQDNIIIYTGYTEKECVFWTTFIKELYENIIIKYGRYIPDQESHFDEILGVNLVSPNQYAKKIS